MFRSAALRFAPAVLVAVLALSHGAERAQAWWHHWGCHDYAYGHAPLFPVLRRPLLHRWAHGPRWFHWLHAYRYPHWYHAPSYCDVTYGYAAHYPGYAVNYGWGYDSYGGAIVDPYYDPLGPPMIVDPYDAAPRVLPERAPYVPADPAPLDEPPLLPPQEDAPPAVPRVETPLPADPPPALPADPAPALPLLPDVDGARRLGDSTVLAVRVPTDARVYVNGMLTRTPGSYRQYVSRGLAPGRSYTYEIRAEVDRDGRQVSETQTVTVQAGDMRQTAFRLDPHATPQVAQTETLLTLRVPEAARVTLEGQETHSLGAQRQFSTRELSPGEVWSGYRITIETDEDGTVRTHEKTIDLVGGQRHELAFDEAPQQVAAR